MNGRPEGLCSGDGDERIGDVLWGWRGWAGGREAGNSKRADDGRGDAKKKRKTLDDDDDKNRQHTPCARRACNCCVRAAYPEIGDCKSRQLPAMRVCGRGHKVGVGVKWPACASCRQHEQFASCRRRRWRMR
jgi:hypothetical protein